MPASWPALGPQGPPGGTIISGVWQYDVATVPPPLPGHVRTAPNPAIIGAPYTIYLASRDDAGMFWSANVIAPDDEIMLRGSSGTVQHCLVNGFSVPVGGPDGYKIIETTLVSATGDIPKNSVVEVSLIQPNQLPPAQWTQMTQAAYDALEVKDPNILYVIIG